MIFERYHIQGPFAIELLQISIWRANKPFQILKSSENLKSTALDQDRIRFVFLTQMWTKSWWQIHKIKKIRLFCGMFYGWFFCNILAENVKSRLFGGRLVTPPSNPSISRILLKCPTLTRSYVLTHWATGKATGTFTLWW